MAEDSIPAGRWPTYQGLEYNIDLGETVIAVDAAQAQAEQARRMVRSLRGVPDSATVARV